MKKLLYLLLAALIYFVYTNVDLSQFLPNQQQEQMEERGLASIESVGSLRIKYTGYEVSYNYKYKIPNWVKYELTDVEADGPNARNGKKFRPDPNIMVPQAVDDDYRNSGWSRGHMAPAADFKWSDKAMWDTFYFTNCCPQNQSLNAGQWSTLENKTREAAKRYGSVNVVSGPLVGDNAYGTIGENRVVVPDAFFKAMQTEDQAIAFVMYNREDNENIQRCAMSVDKLEELIGLDLFSELDDASETKLEASYILKYWGL